MSGIFIGRIIRSNREPNSKNQPQKPKPEKTKPRKNQNPKPKLSWQTCRFAHPGLVHVAAVDELGHAPAVANGKQAQAQADDHGDAHDEIVIHA